MRRCLVVAVGLAVVVAGGACSRQAKGTPGVPPGGSHADAPEHPCTWFTAAEIGDRLGTRVRDGQVAGPLGTACQWEGVTDSKAFVQIQVVREVSFWTVPRGLADLAMLNGVGKEAYVVPAEGGFKAAGLLENAFVSVFVGGATANRAVAERLLVDTLSRVR